MQVSVANDVKVYNLTAGKSVPEWLEERKRRKLISEDVELQQRIQLLQGFDMPTVSTRIKVSKDGQFVLAAGTYKPVIKCFDVQQLALKFERGFQSEIVDFLSLADDYTKLVFLHEDRYVEFHNQGGRYYTLRVPRFGRQLTYNRRNCDMIVVGNGPDIYRINLEQGRFLQPYTSTQSSGFNACEINDYHHLVAAASQEGTVECWDPRTRKCVGSLDTAQFVDTSSSKNFPENSCLKFDGALGLAVGTSTGQVLMFDIRSNKPTLIKDHHYDFAINSVHFSCDADERRIVLSSDKKGVKAWLQQSGELVTAIEPSDCEINHACLYPNSGLMFLAAETQKMQAFFVPSLGPAPKWCSFLENLTEEMEEDKANVVYDDYKFVTRRDLEALNLAHLIGSKTLRAYMHGYFVNVQLYTRAKRASEPFAFEEFKQKKIQENIERQRSDRVKLEKLPEVNKETAVRLRMEQESGKAKAKKEAGALLSDDRFASKFFGDPDMQIDLNKEDLDSMNPTILARMVQLQPAMVQASEAIREEQARSRVKRSWQDVDENVNIKTSALDAVSEEESESSEDENSIKKVRKAARRSAKAQRDEENRVKSDSKVPKSKLIQNAAGKSAKVELVATSSVLERDLVVPVRSKMSLNNINSESTSLEDRLMENESLTKQVDIGLNRSQSAAIVVSQQPKKEKGTTGKKRSRKS